VTTMTISIVWRCLKNYLNEEIERHAKDCVACFSCMETLKKTVALCKNAQEQPVPQEFSRKLQEIIQNLPKTSNP